MARVSRDAPPGPVRGRRRTRATTSSATKLRRGVDPGTLGDGAADDVGEHPCRFVAHGRKAHGREVVDGDDPGGVPGRWHHEVRPVDDIGRPGEPLDRGTGDAGPDPVERSSRHGPLDHPDAGRHQGGQEMATPPRHGEGGHVEIGPLPQGLEGAPTEHPDTGAHPEERRGVDGHREPVALLRITQRHPGSLAHRGSGPRSYGGPLAWLDDHRPRRRSGCGPPPARPRPCRHPGRGHSRGEHRRRHRPARPGHLPRPRHGDLHAGADERRRARLGPGRRDLDGDGSARTPRWRDLVPTR